MVIVSFGFLPAVRPAISGADRPQLRLMGWVDDRLTFPARRLTIYRRRQMM
ncbi:MAG: hypothetical protein JW749_01430 [Sedimentisphaerales bacterium]|nr:hypothetical protein [Sedimentisphaerales bacterium]